MILEGREIVDSIDGVIGLAVQDPVAPRRFHVSAEGFWNSFLSMGLVAPFWLAMIAKQRSLLAERAPADANTYADLPLAAYLGVETLFYVLGWILFPVAMISVCRRMGLMGNYVPFIIARNWMNFVAWFVLVFPPFMLFNLGVMQTGGFRAFSLFSIVAQYYLLWVVAETMLGTRGGRTVVVILIDFALLLLMTFLHDLAYLPWLP